MKSMYDDIISSYYGKALVSRLQTATEAFSGRWTKYSASIDLNTSATTGVEDTAILKHWIKEFTKLYPSYKLVMNPSDPFLKDAKSISITNGKYTITSLYPMGEFKVLPRLHHSGELDNSFGIDYTSVSTRMFTTWALGLAPLPEELK